MIMSKDDLIAAVKDILARIEANDSFEGNISYTCMKEGLPPRHFDVAGAWRHGNSMGQGGVSMIPESEEKEEG